MTAFEINFFYAWVGLPLLLTYSIYSGEIYMISDVFHIGDANHRFNFLLLLFLSGSLGIAITMTSLLVVTLCSPFTININGNIKNAFSSVLGFVIFDNEIPSLNVISGILIGFSGSCLYAYDELKSAIVSNKIKSL